MLFWIPNETPLDRWMNGRMGGWVDGQTDRRTDGRMGGAGRMGGRVRVVVVVGGMIGPSWVLPPQGNKGRQTRRETGEYRREIRGNRVELGRRA